MKRDICYMKPSTNRSYTSHSVINMTSAELLYKGKWLQLMNRKFTTKTGAKKTWEYVTRLNVNKDLDCDCASILAIIKEGDDMFIPVVVQHRYPLGTKSVELPAGLIDPKESYESTAVRELKEETGYVGEYIGSFNTVCLNAGLCDERMRVCVISVDGDLDVNRNPVPEQEDGEDIEVDKLWLRAHTNWMETLNTIAAKHSAIPFVELQGIVMGLEMGRRASTDEAKYISSIQQALVELVI